MISYACTSQIEPDISIRKVEDKTVLIIDIMPGKFRPYYYLRNLAMALKLQFLEK